jgi:hypothetical protein
MQLWAFLYEVIEIKPLGFSTDFGILDKMFYYNSRDIDALPPR